MHGTSWLEDPVLSIVFFGIGAFFLFLALRTEDEHRKHQHHEAHSGIELSLLGRKVIDTSRGWFFFTMFIGSVALGAHFISEYTFHLYDTTSIDSLTHGLSAMGITAIVLNFYLTKRKRLYFPVSIGAAWIGFTLWEVYEWIMVGVQGPMGFIQTEPLDMGIDLWVDTLGSLAICFLYSEFVD